MDDSPPPPYDFQDVPTPAKQQGAESKSDAQPQQSTSLPARVQPQPSHLLPFHNLLRTHQRIGIYKAGCSDFCLGLSADSSPLAHITSGSWGKPSLSLHAGSSSISPVIATAHVGYFSASMICIAPETTLREPTCEDLARVSDLSEAWGFEMRGPVEGRREGFQWKESCGEEVRKLDGSTRGLKLVRVGTGEVVCAYAWTAASTRKVGKFRWVSEEDWGTEADLMEVVTLLAVVEWIKTIRSTV